MKWGGQEAVLMGSVTTILLMLISSTVGKILLHDVSLCANYHTQQGKVKTEKVLGKNYRVAISDSCYSWKFFIFNIMKW